MKKETLQIIKFGFNVHLSLQRTKAKVVYMKILEDSWLILSTNKEATIVKAATA